MSTDRFAVADTVTASPGCADSDQLPPQPPARATRPAQCATSITGRVRRIGDEFGDDVMAQVGGEVDIDTGGRGGRQERVTGSAADRDGADHPVRVTRGTHTG